MENAFLGGSVERLDGDGNSLSGRLQVTGRDQAPCLDDVAPAEAADGLVPLSPLLIDDYLLLG